MAKVVDGKWTKWVKFYQNFGFFFIHSIWLTNVYVLKCCDTNTCMS